MNKRFIDVAFAAAFAIGGAVFAMAAPLHVDGLPELACVVVGTTVATFFAVLTICLTISLLESNFDKDIEV